MTSAMNINQLVIIIVSGIQAGDLMKRLTREKFYFTQIDSSGGLLQEPTLCLLIGLNDERITLLLALIKECCPRRRQFIPARVEVPQLQIPPMMIEAEVGGATTFTIPVELFEQL